MDIPRHRLSAATAFAALLLVATTPACRVQDSGADAVSSAPLPAPADAPAIAAPKWAVSPTRAGPDTPPAGRSLFDLVVTREDAGRLVEDIPYPMQALFARVNERAGCGSDTDCLRVVLVPLGRSLQRLAASPDFFAHPRVVAAVDRAGDADGMLLKDRLYIGFQERSGMLEVISYNEEAARFEFQLVHDYREGGTPRVSYARREVCAACHQNMAPVFSRPLWTETNANPQVAAALAAHGEAFAGVPVHRGVDIPNAIDDATDRANMFGVWQRLWIDGCGHEDDRDARRCRAAVVLAALQHRLAGGRGFDEEAPGWSKDFLPAFAREWQARWPAGLAIPNPDLPARDPLQADAGPLPLGDAMAHVPARFDPLQPRPPLDTWRADDAAALGVIARHYVAGLGDFFTDRELGALDRQLRARAGADGRREYASACTVVRDPHVLAFRCAPATTGDGARLSGRIALDGGRLGDGVINDLAINGSAPMSGISVTPGRAFDARGVEIHVRDRDRHARLIDGRVIDAIRLDWTADGTAAASVAALDDIAPLRDALAALADEAPRAESPLAPGPFKRARLTTALFAQLGMDGQTACCDPAAAFLPIRVEPPVPPAPTRGEARAFAAFFKDCGGCHATGERSPPNFLAGSGAELAARMRHCAPRLFVRLAMWHREPGEREKTPMPPPYPSATGVVRSAPRGAAALERIAADLLREETGAAPQLDALLAKGYETLRPCLPDAAT